MNSPPLSNESFGGEVLVSFSMSVMTQLPLLDRRDGGGGTVRPLQSSVLRESWAPRERGAHRSKPRAPHAQTAATTVTLRACGPFGPSSTSYSTFAPSARLLNPSPLIALWWTKTSLPSASCVMKP